MTLYNVYANGTFWTTVEAYDEADAIQKVADQYGTEDVRVWHSGTKGMTAVEADEDEE